MRQKQFAALIPIPVGEMSAGRFRLDVDVGLRLHGLRDVRLVIPERPPALLESAYPEWVYAYLVSARPCGADVGHIPHRYGRH